MPTDLQPQSLASRNGHAPARIPLFSADEAFEQALDPRDAEKVRAAVSLPGLELAAGPWKPDLETWSEPTIGALVVDGLIGCNLTLGRRASTELIGPGDIFTPIRPDNGRSGGTMTWFVHRPCTLAVLDDAFLEACRRWPPLLSVVHRRLGQRLDRLALRSAVLQLSRVEERLLTVLWQIADRFGRACTEGVVIGVPLTHQVIGQVAGAQRPTVTLALQAMQEQGLVARHADGSLLLPWDSREQIDAELLDDAVA